MQGNFFMQLLLLAALLLLGSGADRPQFTSSEMSELLKYVSEGNSELENIVKQVEQFSGIINTFAPLVNSVVGGVQSSTAEANDAPSQGLYLKPIANIADDGIYNALSGAIT